MKRRNPKYFTMIELMFVVAILVILVGISWVAGTKVLRGQTEAKTKAEITLLINAIEQYKTRWGSYPYAFGATPSDRIGDLDFAHLLSKVLPDSGWSGKRPMYVNYDSSDIIVDNNYDDNGGSIDVTSLIKVYDPYENAYKYAYDADTDTYIVYSAGLDGEAETHTDASDYVTTGNNEDNIVSTDL